MRLPRADEQVIHFKVKPAPVAASEPEGQRFIPLLNQVRGLLLLLRAWADGETRRIIDATFADLDRLDEFLIEES